MVNLCVLCLLLFCSSCAIVEAPVEVGKTIWGSSTRVLEKARVDAITKTYDKPYWETLRATLDVIKKNEYVIFKKDEIRGYMILMGVKGAVNTTEIGVFFVEVSENQTRIELASLSTHAKRLLAKGLFHGLDIAFGLVPPDPELLEGASSEGNGKK